MLKNILRNASSKKQGKIYKVSSEIHRIHIKTEVMLPIGIYIGSVPEIDGFKHLMVSIDYFSKWLEAKPIKDINASTIAQFLYEIICRHGCMKIQIDDQWSEFMNGVSKVLHNMTGTQRHITSAYHSQ